jgi:flagellar assembly factor FliW
MDLSPSNPLASPDEPPAVGSQPARSSADRAGPPREPAATPGPSVAAAPESGPDELGPLVLPAGLPGFPDARSFRLRRLPGATGFAILECLEPEGPRFVVLEVSEPELVFGPPAVAEAATALGIAASDLLMFAIVTLTDGPAGRRAHVNLRAPVVVDRVGLLARQLVLADPGLPLRHPLEPRAAA